MIPAATMCFSQEQNPRPDILGVPMGATPSQVASALSKSGYKKTGEACYQGAGSSCIVKAEEFKAGNGVIVPVVTVKYSRLDQKAIEIDREETYEDGKQPTLENLFSSQKQKYGQPTSHERITNFYDTYWLKTTSGKPNLKGLDGNCRNGTQSIDQTNSDQFRTCKESVSSHVVVHGNSALAYKINMRITDFEGYFRDVKQIQDGQRAKQLKETESASKVSPKL